MSAVSCDNRVSGFALLLKKFTAHFVKTHEKERRLSLLSEFSYATFHAEKAFSTGVSMREYGGRNRSKCWANVTVAERWYRWPYPKPVLLKIWVAKLSAIGR